MQEIGDTENQKRKPTLVWRWVFICALTAQITLSAITVIRTTNSEYLIETSGLGRADIIQGIELASSLILIAFTPYIYSLRGLAGAFAWLFFSLVTSMTLLPVT